MSARSHAPQQSGRVNARRHEGRRRGL